MASARGNTYDITTRAQAVALKEVGFTNARVSEITGIGIRQIQKYYAAARERGYNPIESKVLKDNILLINLILGSLLKRLLR